MCWYCRNSSSPHWWVIWFETNCYVSLIFKAKKLQISTFWLLTTSKAAFSQRCLTSLYEICIRKLTSFNITYLPEGTFKWWFFYLIRFLFKEFFEKLDLRGARHNLIQKNISYFYIQYLEGIESSQIIHLRELNLWVRRGSESVEYVWNIELCWVRVKNVWPGSGQPFMIWVWIWKISLKTSNFSIFSLRIKKSHWVGSKSTWVKGRSVSYLLQVKSKLWSGQGPSLNCWALMDNSKVDVKYCHNHVMDVDEWKSTRFAFMT